MFKLENVYSLLELVAKLTVGPLNMPEIDGHATKNITALLVLALLLTVSITVFSGGINISFLGAGALSVITSAIVGIIGLGVNLVIPAPTVSPLPQNAPEQNTNKFVTYAVVSFLMTVMTFVLTGFCFLIFGHHITSLVDLLTVDFLVKYDTATKIVSMLCGTVGTGLLYLALKVSKRLYVSGVELVTYMVATALICSFVFHMSHFVFFS